MRIFIYIFLTLFYSACSNTKSISESTNKMNGVWIPVYQEMGGMPMPETYFAKQKLIIQDSVYVFSAESEDKGILHYEKDKMDIFGKEGVNAGKHFFCIYKWENNQLTICYNLIKNAYPQSFETSSQKGLFLSRFKKAVK